MRCSASIAGCTRPRRLAFGALVLIAGRGAFFAGVAAAQEQDPPASDTAAEAAAEPETRPTGLPKGVDWTFNLDVTIGAFGFNDSLYTNPKPEQPSGDLGDNWFEGSVKPGLTATYTSEDSWQFYGVVSGVGERTFGAAPSVAGEDASSFNVEDLHIGWRSGSSLELGENVLELTVGRAPFQLGHGFLLLDGAAEGGSRGGYWTNARKAFELAAIGRFKPGHNTLEAFYLDKDDLPEEDSASRLWGLNYEYAIGENTTLGATYMDWSANPSAAPERDGLEVYNARAFTAPFPGLEGLSFEAEYAQEDNDEALDSEAWTAQIAYQLDLAWEPTLSYRYAFFEGDDPETVENEAFDPLFVGFYDWGTWWQGEIAGEYFLSNSNLISHQVRLHVTPTDAIGTGLLLWDFRFDRPEAAGPGVTADDIAYEADWYMDWSLNSNFTLNLVAAYADPGDAARQAFDRTDNFLYGMAYLAYKY